LVVPPSVTASLAPPDRHRLAKAHFTLCVAAGRSHVRPSPRRPDLADRYA